MVVGATAYLHCIQINTLNSTFNATIWANASGMGCAMVPWVFVLILNDSGLCVGCFRGVGVTRG